jgi:hypothetical protein
MQCFTHGSHGTVSQRSGIELMTRVVYETSHLSFEVSIAIANPTPQILVELARASTVFCHLLPHPEVAEGQCSQRSAYDRREDWAEQVFPNKCG